MTKEELKQEAEEYIKKNYVLYSISGNDIDLMTQAYLASAEPREKQIQIDAEQIRALQKQNGELTDKVRGLEAQIEKMKVKWHDLEKDPSDLPKNCKTMCVCLGDFGSKYEPVPRVCVGYCDSLGWSDYMGSSLYSTVRYWCELPKF